MIVQKIMVVMFFIKRRLGSLKNTRTFVLKEKVCFFDTPSPLWAMVESKDNGTEGISNIINNFKCIIYEQKVFYTFGNGLDDGRLVECVC